MRQWGGASPTAREIVHALKMASTHAPLNGRVIETIGDAVDFQQWGARSDTQ
jgi:hypothetical protein